MTTSFSPSPFCRLFLLLLLISGGCAAVPPIPPGEEAEATVVPEPVAGSEGVGFPIDVYDPWEGWNRSVYRFNAEFDQLIFLPVVETYRFLAPKPVEESVDNVFTNLDNIITIANQFLQAKPFEAAQTFFRFAVNSTVGVLGLFDPASAIGVPKHKEDFGQTLGVWGAGEGPYMVLPILGPSNLRDTTGLVVDRVAFALTDPLGASSIQTEYPPILALNIINSRARVDFRYYQTGSPFEYDLLRFLYTKKRQLDIAK